MMYDDPIPVQMNRLIKSENGGIGVFNNEPASPKLIPYTVNADALILSDKAKEVFNNRLQNIIHQIITVNKPAYSIYYEDKSPLYALLSLLRKLGVVTDLSFTGPLATQYTREICKCVYLGIAVEPQHMHRGCQKLADAVNAMADADYLIGCLAPITMIPMDNGTLAIVAYVHAQPNHEDDVKRIGEKFIIAEGGILPMEKDI